MSVAPADGQAATQRSWPRRALERALARPGRSSVLPLAAVVLGLVLAALGMFRGAPAPLAEVPAGYVALVNQKGVLLSDLISQVENATMKRFDEATPEEKRRVLNSMIDEELLVQRALLLDLPETTIEVREAMQQGVEAQVAEPYWSLPPTDAELRAYYDKNRSDYTNDGTMTVHDLVMHVGGFQNANQSTPQALSDAADAVYRLRSGASVDYAKEHYGFVDSNRLPAVEELDFVVRMRLGDKLFEVASALGNGEIKHARRIASLSSRSQVDYSAVWAIKREILDAVFADFEDTAPVILSRAFQAFIEGGGKTLLQFACFQAISESRRGEAWTQWPDDLARQESALQDFAQENARQVRFHLFLQWLCERQLASAEAEGRKGGLWLGFYRDLAVGAAPDGAECWANADQLMRACSVGAPPDPFAENGQNWGLQPPNPVTWQRSGYASFNELTTANMRHAGALRMDHAMALRRLFVIPNGARALEGAYLSYPVHDLIGAARP